jgi:hypothetical protein
VVPLPLVFGAFAELLAWALRDRRSTRQKQTSMPTRGSSTTAGAPPAPPSTIQSAWCLAGRLVDDAGVVAWRPPAVRAHA